MSFRNFLSLKAKEEAKELERRKSLSSIPSATGLQKKETAALHKDEEEPNLYIGINQLNLDDPSYIVMGPELSATERQAQRLKHVAAQGKGKGKAASDNAWVVVGESSAASMSVGQSGVRVPRGPGGASSEVPNVVVTEATPDMKSKKENQVQGSTSKANKDKEIANWRQGVPRQRGGTLGMDSSYGIGEDSVAGPSSKGNKGKNKAASTEEDGVAGPSYTDSSSTSNGKAQGDKEKEVTKKTTRVWKDPNPFASPPAPNPDAQEHFSRAEILSTLNGYPGPISNGLSWPQAREAITGNIHESVYWKEETAKAKEATEKAKEATEKAKEAAKEVVVYMRCITSGIASFRPDVAKQWGEQATKEAHQRSLEVRRMSEDRRRQEQIVGMARRKVRESRASAEKERDEFDKALKEQWDAEDELNRLTAKLDAQCRAMGGDKTPEELIRWFLSLYTQKGVELPGDFTLPEVQFIQRKHRYPSKPTPPANNAQPSTPPANNTQPSGSRH